MPLIPSDGTSLPASAPRVATGDGSSSRAPTAGSGAVHGEVPPQVHIPPEPPAPRKRPTFAEDFRRFFTRGLATVLPTLITISFCIWVWSFLWEHLGQHIIWLVKLVWFDLVAAGVLRYQEAGYIGRYWNPDLYPFRTQLLGVTLAILLVYIVGVFVGNLIGRTAWRLAEQGVMRIPLVRAIYPAVKQVTDFVLADRQHQFQGSRVVAVKPHADGIWQLGLVTGTGNWSLNPTGPEEMVSVFLPSTPTAFSGYVIVVPRAAVVELPMTVEELFRLLITGGVISPGTGQTHRIDSAGVLTNLDLPRDQPSYQAPAPPPAMDLVS